MVPFGKADKGMSGSVPHWQQWRWRVKALTVALVLISGLAYVGRQRSEAHRMQVVEINNVKALQVKADIERRFAIGTAEAELVEFLRNEYRGFQTMHIGGQTEYWVPIGREPSGVWYCGSFTAYVAFEFVGARLTGTRITRWSADCL
jgi:hypothetical protein